jgi:hypothetical protein
MQNIVSGGGTVWPVVRVVAEENTLAMTRE